MARKTARKTPKSKWARKVNQKKSPPRRQLKGKQLAKFQFLMGGGALDESE